MADAGDIILSRFGDEAPASSADTGDAILARFAGPSREEMTHAPSTRRIDPDKGPAVSPSQMAAATAESERLRSRSKAEAVGRGVIQGGTFGFGDEIGGAFRSVFGDEGYREARDKIRANDRAAREAHPIAFGAGEVGGGIATSFVPGLGVVGGAARGAKLAATAGKAALAGGTYGLGASEGETAGELAADTLRGAALGGAAGAVGYGVAKGVGASAKGAQGRLDKRLMGDIGDRATPTTRAKLAERPDAVLETARAHGLDRLARDPEKLLSATDAAKSSVGAALKPIYAEADAAIGGVPITKVLRALHKVEQKYQDANPEAAKAIARRIEHLRERFQTTNVKGSVARIPSDKIREQVTAMQEGAFASADIAPKVGIRSARDAAGALKQVLADHVDEAIDKGADVARGHLQKLNREYASLSLIGQAAKKRASLDPFPATGLRSIASATFGPAFVLASGHPLGAAALAARPLVRPAADLADRALAGVVRAARGGASEAEVVARAARAGVSREVARSLYGRFGGMSPSPGAE